MARFARLNDPDPKVRARLQAALYANRRRRLTRNTGGGASAYAPYPAPDGYAWDFVTYGGDRVTYLNQPVVALVRIN